MSVCVCVHESLCFKPEINTTVLQFKKVLGKVKKKKNEIKEQHCLLDKAL